MNLSHSTKPAYFNGLNALRFFAAALVVFHHIEEIRHGAGLFNLKNVDLFQNGGPAVSFFFVLSGFLITYVLRNEIQKTGTISIKYFYVKRSLRIWPLYFLLVIIGFVVLPLLLQGDKYISKFPYLSFKGALLYILFLPNLATGFWRGHFLLPLWSIGVEEQFYLFFAPLAQWFKKNLIPLLVGIIIIRFISTSFLQPLIENKAYFYLVNSMRFENMAIGGLFMLLMTNRNHTITSLITSKVFQIFTWCYILFYLGYHWEGMKPPVDIPNGLAYFFYNLFNASMFASAILNTCLSDTALFKFKSKALFKLGEISYGIYMYHMLFVFAGVEIMKKLNLTGGTVSTAFIYLFVFGAAIVTAHLSFKFIEKPIIGLKRKLKS